MKRIVRCVVLGAVLLTSTSCFSKQINTILSVDAAKHYQAKSIGKAYIQTDRFLRKSNAKYYQDFVQSNTNYPVKIRHYHGYYYVTIGPILSASEVRKTAKTYNVSQEPVKSVEPIKPIVHTATPKATPLIKHPYSASHVRSHSLVQKNWIVSVGAGVQYPNFKSSMSINNGSGASPPYNQDIYTTKSRTQPIVEFAAGYRWAWARRWAPAVSVVGSYQHLFSRNVGKNVIQYSDPAFTNYAYDWEVASDVFLALVKLNVFEAAKFSPYVAAGVGGAVNRISNYSDGPLPGVAPRTNPGFQSTTRLKPAYRIGGGVDYQVNSKMIVSAEYQYQGIGTVSSKHGTGTWSGEFLNLGTYRANGVLLSLTCLIDK